MSARLRHIRIYACVGLVLLALVFAATLRRPDRTEKLAWIQTSEIAERFRPGVLTRLKFRILRLPGPFWRMYMSGRTQIVIDARQFALDPDSIPLVALPSECYTNADGARAWILSAQEFTSLNRQVNALPGCLVGHAFRLTTMDGGQAQLTEGSSRIVGAQPTFLGMRIDLLPKVSGHLFQLGVGAFSTQPTSRLDGAIPEVITNFAAGCTARVPNGGGLIIQGPTQAESQGTNYWLLISPSAVDARGSRTQL